MRDWFIECQVSGERIYENELRMQPNGGVIHCLKCWAKCMESSHGFCGRKKGKPDLSDLNPEDPVVLGMIFGDK